MLASPPIVHLATAICDQTWEVSLQDKHKRSKKDDKLLKEAKKFLKQSEHDMTCLLPFTCLQLPLNTCFCLAAPAMHGLANAMGCALSVIPTMHAAELQQDGTAASEVTATLDKNTQVCSDMVHWTLRRASLCSSS